MKPLLTLFNHLLAQAPWARQRLAPFAGRRAAILAAAWRIEFIISSHGELQAVTEAEARTMPPEVTIRLPAEALFLLPQGSEKLFAAAHVEGAADFASTLGFVLQHLTWDYEEDLARLFGDIAAHRLAGAWRDFAQWQREAARRLIDNLAEYLTEEKAMLLTRRELAPLAQEIAAFEARLQQSELRLAKLER